MSIQNSQILDLEDCIDRLANEVYLHKPNATINLIRKPLTEYYDSSYERLGAYQKYADKINGISAQLSKLKMKKFISLVQTAEQANIAIALNAGDGIVAKITDTSYLSKVDEPLPGQLPPIHRFDTEGVAIEIFPWVRRLGMQKSDVDNMQVTLKGYGLRFKPGDARPDNIGKMPNGELVVLDGGALEVIPDSPVTYQQRQELWDAWLKHVQDLFNPLYTPEYYNNQKPLISESPDFSERLSPLIKSIIVEQPTTQAAKQPSSFLQRMFKPPGFQQGK